MACLNMQQQQQQQQQQQMKNEKGLFMGPRISFSNDFVESSKNKHENMSYREAPVSSDFEFCVPTFSSNSADEVFFKLPPLKVTLRDELLAGDDDDDDDDDGYNNNNRCKNSSSTGTGWWREKFGLRKSQNKNHGGGGLETIHEAKIKPTFSYTPNFTGSHHQYK